VVEIPEFVRSRLAGAYFWQLATICADGSPTSTPVWVDVDAGHVIVNTAVGRLKERNVRRDPRVALSFVDPDNPYTWIEIRGRVAELVEGQEAHDSIDALARKYLGREYQTAAPGERRVILRIEPRTILTRTEAGASSVPRRAAVEDLAGRPGGSSRG
jgi:PPOX class probable F420-dependent enzyme